MRDRDKLTEPCPSCGEELIVAVDLSAGMEQEFVEDCAVCCRPLVFALRVEGDGSVVLRVRQE